MASLRIAISAVRIERVCSPTCHSFSISSPSEVTRITSRMPVEIARSVRNAFRDIVAHIMSLVVVPARRLLRGPDALARAGPERTYNYHILSRFGTDRQFYARLALNDATSTPGQPDAPGRTESASEPVPMVETPGGGESRRVPNEILIREPNLSAQEPG
jgi:hypothetical protein